MNVSLDGFAEKVFDGFKRITPALVAVTILTGLLLFLPRNILEKMNLDDLPVLWNRIIGLFFLLSISLIGTIIVFALVSRVMKRNRSKRIRENLKKTYLSLNAGQKEIIQALLSSDTKTVSLEINSGDAIYLKEKKFLHLPHQPVSLGWDNELIVSFVPQPWLLDLYNEEPEFFDQ